MDSAVLSVEGLFAWSKAEGSPEPNEWVGGTLTIHDNGAASLSLIGLLPDDTGLQSLFGQMSIEPDKCIVGRLKGNNIAFLRSMEGNGASLGTMISHQALRAREVLIFSNLESVPNLDDVTSFEISLNDLGEWASEPAVFLKDEEGRVAVEAQPVEKREFTLPDRSICLKSALRHRGPRGFYYHSVSIEQHTYLEYKVHAGCDLARVRKEFHLAEDLFLLLSDVNVVLPWPTVRYGNVTAKYYFERSRSEGQSVNELKSWATLRWPTIDLGKALSNLETQQDLLGPGLYLYLGVQRSPALYLENRFSTFIFGLESMHRRGNTSVAASGLADKVARILSCIEQKKDRDWLGKRLRNAADPSLAERIFSVFSELGLGFDVKSLRQFSESCADTRNEIAHLGGQRDGSYEDFATKMRTLSLAVRPLYHAALLSRIGIEDKIIHSFFHRSPLSHQLKSSLRDAGLTFLSPSPSRAPQTTEESSIS